MSYKIICLLLITIFLGTGCGMNIVSESVTPTAAEFVTVTLPPSPIPHTTQTLPAPTPMPSIIPLEGTTTTEVNVRAQTSTASETLGTIGQFSKVQVIGKDQSGSWYQIIYTQASAGTGWVRAEYVQMDASAQVPVIGSAAGSGSGLSGVVIQKINVRSGPAVTFDSLGALNPKDVVFIVGRDSSGAWIQIEFLNSPNGVGWVALKYLQVDNVDSVPVIAGPQQPAPTPEGSAATPSAKTTAAMQDGDSMQAPLITAFFSAGGSHALQVTGDVSAPDGDLEDWVQFNSTSENLMIQIDCTSNTLEVNLWNNEGPQTGFSLSCGKKQVVTITPDTAYFVHMIETSEGKMQYTSYTLRMESIP